ncbi:hypothetical protein JCM3765_007356 [Sporobolomyces pararoseus]
MTSGTPILQSDTTNSLIGGGGSGGTGFVPRAVKKRKVAAAVQPPSTRTVVKTTTTTIPSNFSSSSTAPPPLPLSPQSIQKFEQILTVLESSFSDHGLTSYSSGSQLKKLLLEEGEGNGGGGWIHLSKILKIVEPIRALTSTLIDLKTSVKLRDSKILKVDETGYQITRRNYNHDLKESNSNWNDSTLYLENIPFHSTSTTININDPTSFSLTEFLSQALQVGENGNENENETIEIQKLVLPALYDPKNPIANLDQQDQQDADQDSELQAEEEDDSQTRAFKASLIAAAKLKELQEQGIGERQGEEEEGTKRKIKNYLPRGGGGFKGFCFIVLKNPKQVETVLRDWNWNRIDDGEGEGEEQQGDSKEKGKGKVEMSPREKAKTSGMKAMTFSRWLELKKEYLSYKRNLEKLIKAQGRGELDELRNPLSDVKDQPPHLQQPPPPQQPTQHDQSTSRTSGIKRAYSPPLTTTTDSNKRTKRVSSPSSQQQLLPPVTNTTRHTRKLRTPSPLPQSPANNDDDDEVALSIQGAYPLGCVLWLRNLNEKSSKTSLKNLLSKLLDTLQEGSGKGIEFVDYEKGLQTCYLRFSSSNLTKLILEFFLKNKTFHLEPNSFSPVESLGKGELEKVEQEMRRPLMVELLKGEMEKSYWQSLPESTRKAARLGAGGKVGLIKEPRGYNNTSGNRSGETTNRNGRGKREIENGEMNGNLGEEPNKKRKKPSRM